MHVYVYVRPTAFPSVAANDPLTFRPRPSDLVSKVQMEGNQTVTGTNGEVETDNESGGTTNQPLYVPPRVVAVPYTEDKGLSPKVKHKRNRGSVLQELKDELSDAPIELQVRGVVLAAAGVLLVRPVQKVAHCCTVAPSCSTAMNLPSS